jgi:hypothetical protein
LSGWFSITARNTSLGNGRWSFCPAPGEREISQARKSAVFSMIADYIFVTKGVGDLTFPFNGNANGA